MSINLIRSPRKTEFWKGNTPQHMGPGVYNANRSFTDFNREKYEFIS